MSAPARAYRGPGCVLSPRKVIGKGIARHVMGDVETNYQSVVVKLGHAAKVVWEALCRMRYPDSGLVRTSVRELAHITGIDDRNVRNALERLRSAHIVQDRKRVLVGGRWVLVRYVTGVPATGLLSVVGRCIITKATAKWVLGASGHGGRRKGAGRPRTEVRMGAKSRGAAQESSGAHYQVLSLSEKECLDASPSEKQAPVAATGVVAENGRKTFPMRTAWDSTAERVPELPSPDRFGAVVPGDGGFLIRGAARPPHPAALGLPFPGVPGVMRMHEVAPCVVPNPPMLDPDAPPERHAQLLANWYTSAVEAKTGERCWTFGKSAASKSKHYRLLCEAARVFIEHEIPPAAWVGFSLDVWAAHDATGKPPPVQWVFGAKRIEERRGWFRAEEQDYSGGRQVYVPAALELMQRDARMRQAFARQNPTALEQVLAIVSAHFPAGLRDKLVNEARAQATERRAELSNAVACGKWVW